MPLPISEEIPFSRRHTRVLETRPRWGKKKGQNFLNPKGLGNFFPLLSPEGITFSSFQRADLLSKIYKLRNAAIGGECPRCVLLHLETAGCCLNPADNLYYIIVTHSGSESELGRDPNFFPTGRYK